MALELLPSYEIVITKLNEPFAKADLGRIDPGAAYDVAAEFRRRFALGDGYKVDLFMNDSEAGRARVLAVVDVLDFRKRYAERNAA